MKVLKLLFSIFSVLLFSCNVGTTDPEVFCSISVGSPSSARSVAIGSFHSVTEVRADILYNDAFILQDVLFSDGTGDWILDVSLCENKSYTVRVRCYGPVNGSPVAMLASGGGVITPSASLNQFTLPVRMIQSNISGLPVLSKCSTPAQIVSGQDNLFYIYFSGDKNAEFQYQLTADAGTFTPGSGTLKCDYTGEGVIITRYQSSVPANITASVNLTSDFIDVSYSLNFIVN